MEILSHHKSDQRSEEYGREGVGTVHAPQYLSYLYGVCFLAGLLVSLIISLVVILPL